LRTKEQGKHLTLNEHDDDDDDDDDDDIIIIIIVYTQSVLSRHVLF